MSLSAREALVKMCTLPLLAGENISARFVVPTVASSVDLVVHLGIDTQGTRRVNEIVAVPGRVEADIIETEPIFARSGGELRRLAGIPTRPERFAQVGIDVHTLLNGSGAGAGLRVQDTLTSTRSGAVSPAPGQPDDCQRQARHRREAQWAPAPVTSEQLELIFDFTTPGAADQAIRSLRELGILADRWRGPRRIGDGDLVKVVVDPFQAAQARRVVADHDPAVVEHPAPW